MNLRPAGGTLRPGGHITDTMNLRRGCRPVTSAASPPRVFGPPGQLPPRRSRAPRPQSPLPSCPRPPSGRHPVTGQPRPGPARTPPPDLSVVRSPPNRRMARRAPDRPRSVPGGSLLGPAGSFTGAPTGSAQTGGLAPPALTASAGSGRRRGNPVRFRGKPRRQPPPAHRLQTGAVGIPNGTCWVTRRVPHLALAGMPQEHSSNPAGFGPATASCAQERSLPGNRPGPMRIIEATAPPAVRNEPRELLRSLEAKSKFWPDVIV